LRAARPTHRDSVPRVIAVAAAVGIVGSLLMSAASAAPAAADVQYVSASTRVGSQIDQHAACPAGTHVTGGGVDVSSAETDRRVSLAASVPWDGPDADLLADDGWLGVANNEGFAHRTMKVFAICAASGTSGYLSESVALTGAGQQDVTVECPVGFHISGGGMRIDGNGGTANKVNGSYPEDGGDPDAETNDVWHATGINAYPNLTETLTVHAICSPANDLSYVTKLTALPPGTRDSLKVPCPAGTSVVGGGVLSSGSGTDDVASASEPFDGPDPGASRDDGWLVTGANGHGGFAFLSAYAVCSPSGTFTRVSAAATLGVRMNLRATCPADTSVTGGGAHVTAAASSPFVKLNTSEPFDGPDGDSLPDDGWLASGSNVGVPPQTMTTFAVCAGSGSFQYVTGSSAALPAGGHREAFAPCPGGSEPTAGGVHVSGARPELVLTVTLPYEGLLGGPDSWAAGENNGTEAAESMSAVVVCRTGHSLTYAEEVATLPLFGQASVKVLCPAQETVLGGGVGIEAPADGDLHVYVNSAEPVDGPDDGSVRDDGWMGFATNETETDTPMYVYAICEA
jgi:hypothetical protein